MAIQLHRLTVPLVEPEVFRACDGRMDCRTPMNIILYSSPIL